MNCSEAGTFIHAYVDGELAGTDRNTYEKHLSDCSECQRSCRLQSRFKAAVRGHLSRRPVPARLDERIRLALDAAPAIRRHWPWHSFPRLAPAAAAAGLLLVILLGARGRTSRVFAQALRTYNAAMPMDVSGSNCGLIADWFRGRVDFSLQPPSLGKLATCQGGRLVNVHDRLGAYLTYQASTGHRLGMMVFDAEDEPMGGSSRREMYGRDVHFVNQQGASAAAFRDRDGLYYIFTGDLDEDSLSGFLNAVFQQRQ